MCTGEGGLSAAMAAKCKRTCITISQISYSFTINTAALRAERDQKHDFNHLKNYAVDVHFQLSMSGQKIIVRTLNTSDCANN